MSFLDDVISTTKSVAEKAGKKTDEAVKFSKLKIKKAQINGDIKTKFEKLGAMIYQMAKSDEKDDDEFNAAIAELDDCYVKLAEVEKQLDDLNNEVACTSCGAKTHKDNSFCPKCGTKLPEREVVKEEAPAAEAAEPAKDAEIADKKEEE